MYKVPKNVKAAHRVEKETRQEEINKIINVIPTILVFSATHLKEVKKKLLNQPSGPSLNELHRYMQ